MDCREAQSLIVPFIENQLQAEQEEAFIKHIGQCSDCYDELEVYFIVFSGIRQLDGETQDISDFKGELKKYIHAHKEALNRRKSRNMRRRVLTAFTVLFILLAGGGVYWMYQTNSAGVQNVVIKVQSAFIYSQGEAVSKTVEDTLDIENWKKSDYKKIIRKVEEESHEENSTD